MIQLRKSRFWLFFIFIIIIFFVIFCYFSISIFLFQEKDLVIYDQDTKVEYVRTPLNPDDVFTVEWVHSVEKTLWQEKFKINDEEEIILVETRFESFGSGVPNQKAGKIAIKDGYVIMSELNEVKEFYQWIHSHNAKFNIKKNGDKFLQTKDVPHHHKAEIIIE